MKKAYNWYMDWVKRHKKISIASTILLVILVLAVSSGSDTSQQTSNQEARQETQAEQQEEATETEPVAEQQQEANLAEEAERSLKAALAIESFTELLMQDSSSLMGYIASFENVNSSTVRVVIQTDLERDEAQQVGRAIFSNAAYDNEQLKALDTLVVRDTSGVDKANVYRQDVPLLNR